MQWLLISLGSVFLAGFAVLAWLLWRVARKPPGAISEFLKLPRGSKPVVLCLGDSLTHGGFGGDWVAMLRDAHPDLTVVNGGFGQALAWNLRQHVEDVAACSPKLVVLMIGTNDVMAAQSDLMAKSYQRGANQLPVLPTLTWSCQQVGLLVDELRKCSGAIAVCTIPPLSGHLSREGELVAEWNRHLETLVEPTS